MEDIKIDLSSQVSYLASNFKNSETKEKGSVSNNNEKKIQYFFSYDDQINKKLIIYELIFQNNSIINQKIKYEIKYIKDMGNNDIHLIAKGNIDNKIYLIFLSDNHLPNLYAGIYDLEINKYFPIIIDNSNNNKKLKETIKQIPDKDYITILEQNKIFFFGGLIDRTKLGNNNVPLTSNSNEEESKTISSRTEYILNKSCLYFDIEKLDLERQKFNENSLFPCFKSGGTSQDGLIYLLGGYSSISNNNEENNNFNYLQFSKYSDDKMYQFKLAKVEGENPKEMIDCDIFIIKNKYLISFSGYKYAKIWFFDILKNKGININLRDKMNFLEFNQDNIFLRLINSDINEINNELNINIVKIVFEQNSRDIKFEIINKSFELKEQ